MDMQKLAEEIIEGKRLTRKDDLSFFLDCAKERIKSVSIL